MAVITWAEAEQMASNAEQQALKLWREFNAQWNSTYARANLNARAQQIATGLAPMWAQMPEEMRALMRQREPRLAMLDKMIGGSHGTTSG